MCSLLSITAAIDSRRAGRCHMPSVVGRTCANGSICWMLQPENIPKNKGCRTNYVSLVRLHLLTPQGVGVTVVSTTTTNSASSPQQTLVCQDVLGDQSQQTADWHAEMCNAGEHCAP